VRDPRKTRRQTPRVPSNVLYDRVVPIALGVLLVLLLVVVGAVLLSLLGLTPGYAPGA